ncbi:cytochrome c3 family protein [uncultured Senegalimassilia sp.]|uniref:cytochrome c3 family protein n=1 Tax=uncultured Senegalimassilia sp. TaxID=1714350 RepID=UPI0027DC0D5F|nr:cytochrome c3 family protein [uncultured Senegalimassilia sp.]
MSELNEATSPAGKRKRKCKWQITAAVVAVVVAVAGAGFWVWHEQPSFCNAICHTPMDPYVAAFEQQPGAQGVDKWGNTVENTSSMLAVVHAAPADQGGADANCLSCHKPTINQQLSEVVEWSTGNMPLYENQTYGLVLGERDTEQLGEWLGQEGDAFCLNSACHNITRQDLVKATARYDERNPHMAMHGQQLDCGDCHKAHRASVNACSQCHDDAPIPEGWLTYDQAQEVASAA